MPTVLVKGREVILDEEDVPLLDSYAWFWLPQGYLATKVTIEKGKRITICLHRMILGDPPMPSIDHINRIKHDNRRCNLRACSVRENNLNRRGWDDPEKGVSFHRGKWQVVVREPSGLKWLGYHKTEEEAVSVASEYFRRRTHQYA